MGTRGFLHTQSLNLSTHKSVNGDGFRNAGAVCRKHSKWLPLFYPAFAWAHWIFSRWLHARGRNFYPPYPPLPGAKFFISRSSVTYRHFPRCIPLFPRVLPRGRGVRSIQPPAVNDGFLIGPGAPLRLRIEPFYQLFQGAQLPQRAANHRPILPEGGQQVRGVPPC